MPDEIFRGPKRPNTLHKPGPSPEGLRVWVLPEDDGGVKKVMVEFGEATKRLLMTPAKARELAETIMTVANKIDGRRLILPPGTR